MHEVAQSPESFGLEGIRENWRNLPRISVRQGLSKISAAGGQGYVKCQCKGACMTTKCACVRAGRGCNSRFHKSNCKCENHNEPKLQNVVDDEDPFEIDD